MYKLPVGFDQGSASSHDAAGWLGETGNVGLSGIASQYTAMYTAPNVAYTVRFFSNFLRGNNFLD